jgi:transposase-like protein
VSVRDVEELLTERGIEFRTTVRRGVAKFGPTGAETG